MKPLCNQTYASLFSGGASREAWQDGGASELKASDRRAPLARRSSIYAVAAGRESRLAYDRFQSGINTENNKQLSVNHYILKGT